MIDQFADLLGMAESAIVHGALVFLRVGTMMALLPAYGERSIPGRVRLVVALCFTAAIAPGTPPLKVGGDAPTIFAYLVSEIAAGLVLGLAIRLFVLALQTAGAIAAQATSLAQIFGNVVVDPQPALGNVMVLAGLTLAVVLDLHLKIVSYVLLSYDLLPPGELPLPEDVASWGMRQTSQMFELAFVLASPFVFVSLLYNLALGAINRAMPQLMVAFVGAPAITFAALLLLFVSLPVLLGAWVTSMNAFLAVPFEGPQ